MNSRLYQLFMAYQGRELDDSFINAAFEIMMEDESTLIDFISDFKVVDDNEPRFGVYNQDDKVIQINRKNIAATLTSYAPNKKILALQIIRKMMEHARNTQRLHECRSDIESTVAKI